MDAIEALIADGSVEALRVAWDACLATGIVWPAQPTSINPVDVVDRSVMGASHNIHLSVSVTHYGPRSEMESWRAYRTRSLTGGRLARVSSFVHTRDERKRRSHSQ